MGVLELAEKGKIKRLFRARNKISYAGAVCHITQRAAGKEPLFVEEEDYLYMLYLLKKKAKEFCFDVFSYVLMPNHLHILVRLNKDNLSLAMKELFRTYAIYFNRKYGRKGHVFGGAFRQALCFSDIYFLAASLYIHLNPVRANLVRKPEEYRWSSCKLYIKPFTGATFINYKFILKILDSQLGTAQKIYNAMLYDAMHIKTDEIWEQPKALEIFKINVVELMPKSLNIKDSAQTEYKEEHELEKKIAELRVKGRLRTPDTIKARKFLIEQLRARGYQVTVIAKMLGISRRAIYHTLTSQN